MVSILKFLIQFIFIIWKNTPSMDRSKKSVNNVIVTDVLVPWFWSLVTGVDLSLLSWLELYIWKPRLQDVISHGCKTSAKYIWWQYGYLLLHYFILLHACRWCGMTSLVSRRESSLWTVPGTAQDGVSGYVNIFGSEALICMYSIFYFKSGKNETLSFKKFCL